MDKIVYLVRHCQATGQEPNAELTEEGKEQAKELMRFFEKRPVQHIISSPFTRAIQSIKPLADSRGLQIEIDDRLFERRLLSESIKDWLERLEESFRDLELKMAGGESSLEVTQLGMEVLETAPDGTVISTHGNIIGLLLKRIDGLVGFKEWEELSHPDVYEVKVKKGDYVARRIWS